VVGKIAANVLQPYFSSGENSTEQLLHDKIMNTNNTVHEAQQPALNKGAVSGSFYGQGWPTSISIRHASDDKVMKVDLSTKEGVKAAEDFCKGTHGFVVNNYR